MTYFQLTPKFNHYIQAELEQSLFTMKSTLDLMQLEREAEDDKDKARKAEKVKEEATACLSQALAKQEKKGWEVVTKVLRAMECICCYEARPSVKVYQCIAGHLVRNCLSSFKTTERWGRLN